MMNQEQEKNQVPHLVKQEQNSGILSLEIDLPPDSKLEVQCNLLNQDGQIQTSRILKFRGISTGTKRKLETFFKSQGRIAFLIAMLLYLLVRLVGIEEFPIYFFSDEAIQSVHAADLIRDRLYSPYGDFLPTFFMNGGQYNLSTSVYAQVLPVLLLGKAVWVTRGTVVLISLLAALGVGLIIETALNRRIGWLAVMVLSLMPAWFLHSRTAFETVLAVSFYTAFVCCYVSYRLKNPKYLYLAALFAALAFYSYSPARIYVGLTLVAFLINDLKYHWKQKKVFLKAFGLGLAFLVPLMRFTLSYPGESIRHLEILNSYWVQNIPLLEKLGYFLREYVQGFNPAYWFLPNNVDLQRHLMKAYGHLWQTAFPFLLIGIGWSIKHIKQSFSRVVLITLLVAPSGAAIVEIGITRALVMVIPATLLTCIGMLVVWDWIHARVGQHRKSWQGYMPTIGIAIFILMGLLNVRMLVDGLKNGATWFSNYGLYGMQYGAQQVFGMIKDELAVDPQKKFYLTSTWANGADVLARFFFDDPVPFQLGSIDGYIKEYKALDSEMVFIMVSDEMKNMLESQKFTNIRIQKILNYPNGEVGFYFVKLDYVKNIENIFAAEQNARRALIKGQVVLQDGEEVEVEYSTLDMGEIFHIFDGDRTTLARTWEANPLRIIVRFPQPRLVEKIVLRVGGEATKIEAYIWAEGVEEPVSLVQEYPEVADPRFTEVEVSPMNIIEMIEVRVTNLNNEEPAHVHLWEMRFLP